MKIEIKENDDMKRFENLCSGEVFLNIDEEAFMVIEPIVDHDNPDFESNAINLEFGSHLFFKDEEIIKPKLESIIFIK